MPPIVGVPCLAMWCSGPWSSLPRIGWPSPRVRNAAIRILVMTSDSTPAVDTGDHHGDHVRRSSSSADDGAVVERSTTSSPIVWVVSWPLPATTTTSPGPAASRARAIAAARSGSTSTFGRSAAATPANTASMIASGPPIAGCQMSRRRDRRAGPPRRPSAAASRVPVAAAAEHDDHAARRRSARAAPRTCSKPSGVWA